MTNIRFGRWLFWPGVLLYVIGLFLPVLGGRGASSQPLSGAGWALDWFLIPWVYAHWHGLRSFLSDSPIENVSVAISGWINPVFLLACASLLVDTTTKTTRVLRYAVLFMIPFSWVAFMCKHVYPREGYVLWVVGMVLVLYCHAPKASRTTIYAS
jgi:hypothetical protein